MRLGGLYRCHGLPRVICRLNFGCEASFFRFSTVRVYVVVSSDSPPRDTTESRGSPLALNRMLTVSPRQIRRGVTEKELMLGLQPLMTETRAMISPIPRVR